MENIGPVKKVADLSSTVLGLTPRKKDWRSTVGMLRDDDLANAGNFSSPFGKTLHQPRRGHSQVLGYFNL